MGLPKAKEETRETWYGIRDPRKRKQIQDRLAQRARRKRLAEASKEKEDSGHVPCKEVSQEASVSPSHENGVLSMTRTQPDTSASAGLCYTPSSNSNAVAQVTEHSLSLVAPLPVDQRHLINPRLKLFEAFRDNGFLLGLICGLYLMRSSRPSWTVPDSLQPTPLQLAMPHYPWIDRLPFPRMRDNLIILSSTLNLEELLNDLIMTESFKLEEGALPWDPNAWRPSPDFQAKWGYLLH